MRRLPECEVTGVGDGAAGAARARPYMTAAVFAAAMLVSVGAFAAETLRTTDGDATFRLGIAAYLTPVRMEEIYAPMALDFGRALDRHAVFRTASSFDKYYEQLSAGSYDITLLHAFFYVKAVDEFDYLPLARMSEPFKGLLVVLETSTARTLADLRGHSIATPPEYLPTVHLVRREMRQSGFDPVRDFAFKSFKSVESCLQQLVIGEAAACVCPPFALPGAEDRMKVRFRVVVESPGIPNLTFVVHKRVPEAERRRLRDAILGWHSNDEGRRLLNSIGTRGFVETRDAEYDEVRRLVKSLDRPWLPSSL